jgi:hypothetical protein
MFSLNMSTFYIQDVPVELLRAFYFSCFTTAVLEGFDVQRTTGYADTEKKYGHLTDSIIDYYRTNFSAGADSSRLCLTYDEFVKRCSDLKKVTVSDVFALQLMQVMGRQQLPFSKLDTYSFRAIVCSLILHAKQVPQVTEEAALAVTCLYPTVFSLAQAYYMLVSLLLLPTYAMLIFIYNTQILLTSHNKCEQFLFHVVSSAPLN